MPERTSRRTFLKQGAAAASLSTAEFARALPANAKIAVIVDPDANSTPVQWAIGKLHESIGPARLASNGAPAAFTIVVATLDSAMAKHFPNHPTDAQPEMIALIPSLDRNSLLVTGADTRGIVYGLLEIADRIRASEDQVRGLRTAHTVIETTPNKVRSSMRSFCSEVEDKPWFYDRAFWTQYLDTLAAARFNRFNLSFGLAYDFPKGVTDDYFHLPYPYLVEVSGFEQVHVEPSLQPGERQRNLETLQFIAAETARRGLEFQLAIWTHAYQWTDSPNSAHHIVGLTPETHAAYCRDALALILKACPQITGLTMRIHGESGIPEGSYDFWTTLFSAIPAARTPDGKPRVIEIDMHAKGLNQRMIDIAHATGMPVKAGAKFWAEHLGLSYQQADIRATEYPRTGVTGTFAVSAGARNFTRYGYGDFYQEGSPVELLYRVWPGTQRHLLWGDPALASGYGRAAHFCGAAGLEIMEPLTFKGREGSGHPGGRDAYADKTLATSTPPVVIPQPASAEESASRLSDLDTAKFELTYMLWGRYLYNPQTAPDFHHRYLRSLYGPAGPGLETALANSSRILPLVTTAWDPSASNHEFWPEIFTPLSILPIKGKPLYGDSPAPHNVSAISPLDPQLFTTIGQHATNLINNTPDARYNTSEVIAWLEAFVRTSNEGLTTARKVAGAKSHTPAYRRAEEDILILNGLGMYYANLFRSALFYSIFDQTHDPAAAAASLAAYGKAREAWATMAVRAKSVYVADISYGATAIRRGDWADRLPAIDADLVALEKYFADNTSPASPNAEAIFRALHAKPHPALAAAHTEPETFHPGSHLPLSIKTPATVTEAALWYRHVNQGERWRSTPMQRTGTAYAAEIPAEYTQSPFPLQYYFELRTATYAALHPSFNDTLSNQPYFSVYKRA